MRNLLTYVLWPVVAGCVFAVTLLGLSALITHFPQFFPFLPQQAVTQSQGMTSFSEAIKRSSPAVVSINSLQQVILPVEIYDSNNPLIRYYTEILDESNTLGSGVIISPDGYIITSYHIYFRPDFASIPEESIVTLSDGRHIEARLVAVDEDSDLALLKVDEENLPYASIGPSRHLEVGEIVLAIGNPRDIGQSVSLGIISALLTRGDDFVIQTDAAINPGNSGGALIDARGNLIGINSTIVSESGGSEGIGFATPADKAIQLMEAYIASGPSGYLGVETNLLSTEFRGAPIHGFRVTRVSRNSPADRAGIREGDLILSADGTAVDYDTGGLGFIQSLSANAPGDTVLIEVLRGEERLLLPAILAAGEPTLLPRMPDSGRLLDPAPLLVPDEGGD